MYNVSEEYRETIHSEVFKTRLTFTIEGDNTTYTDENILKGSFSITNQCTDTKDIKLGAVYVAELSATFRNVNIARQLWRGKQITLTFWLETDEDEETWESVPLGVYTISEAQWKASGVVVRAYDNMTKFDKAFSLNQSGGLLYDFLVVASEECDVELAQTEQQIKAMPNGLTYFSYFSASDVETWRDLISYIAQMLGGFATIDRNGRLEIRQYTQTPVDTLTTQSRFTGGTFSDYVTKYTAVSYVDINTKETKRYAASVDDGITMKLGANPFLQNKSQARAALPNILACVQVIQFTPFNFTAPSNPAFDLGDVVTCTGGLAGASALCCVQKYVFQYHKNYRISGYGADPSVAAARSKTDKEIAGLTASTAAGEMGFYEYRNVTEFNIAEGQRRRVMTLRVAANAITRVHFHININLQTEDTDSNDITKVIASYVVDSAEQDLHPEETYIDGKHVLHLMYVLPMQENSISILSLYLTAESGTITIDREGLWAYASGAGLVGDEEWTGILDIYEDAAPFDIPDEITMLSASSNISISTDEPVGAELSDTVSVLTMPEIDYIDNLVDAVRIVGYGAPAQRLLEDGETNRTTEDGDARMTEEEAT